MRGATRRKKDVRFRRQRVVVETVPDERASDQDLDEAELSEKIEVHVHLHARERRSRAMPPPRPPLNGVLFDCEWYKDRLSKRPQLAKGRWSRSTKCQSCEATIPSTARRCPRCAAPRRRRFLPALLGLVGLGVIAGIVALGTNVLGTSTAQQEALKPLGTWTDDDYVIVEVPPTPPSPFGSTMPSASGGDMPGGVTR